MSDFNKSDFNEKYTQIEPVMKDIQGLMSQKIIKGAAVSMSNDLPFHWKKSSRNNEIRYQNSTQSPVSDFNKSDSNKGYSTLLKPIFSNYSPNEHQHLEMRITGVLSSDLEIRSIYQKLSKYLVKGEFKMAEHRMEIISQMGKARVFIGEETNAKVCDAICRAVYELVRDV